jgi:hypothetical protein
MELVLSPRRKKTPLREFQNRILWTEGKKITRGWNKPRKNNNFYMSPTLQRLLQRQLDTEIMQHTRKCYEIIRDVGLKTLLQGDSLQIEVLAQLSYRSFYSRETVCR